MRCHDWCVQSRDSWIPTIHRPKACLSIPIAPYVTPNHLLLLLTVTMLISQLMEHSIQHSPTIFLSHSPSVHHCFMTNSTISSCWGSLPATCLSSTHQPVAISQLFPVNFHGIFSHPPISTPCFILEALPPRPSRLQIQAHIHALVCCHLHCQHQPMSSHSHLHRSIPAEQLLSRLLSPSTVAPHWHLHSMSICMSTRYVPSLIDYHYPYTQTSVYMHWNTPQIRCKCKTLKFRARE